MIVRIKCADCGYHLGSQVVKGREQEIGVHPVCSCVKKMKYRLDVYEKVDKEMWEGRKDKSCKL